MLNVPPSISLSPLRKAWRFLGLLSRPVVARKLATLSTEGYLHEVGWIQSMATARIVDRENYPIPWLTYPVVDFLTPRLNKTWHVFEYGAGASTRYFASRVGAVTSVEHDELFAQGLRKNHPENAKLVVRAAGSQGYAGALSETVVLPEVILIDGVDRERCIEVAVATMQASAVLILDDAEREEYRPSITLLLQRGFRSVEFWGLAPGVVHKKCTTIFYRPDNVLGL